MKMKEMNMHNTFDEDKYIDTLRAAGRLEEAYNAYRRYYEQAIARYNKFDKRSKRPIIQRKRNALSLEKVLRKANVALSEANDARSLMNKIAAETVATTLTTQDKE